MANRFLFIISLGGRTGSTTVLDMINAHPAFQLSGENDGVLAHAMSMWDAIADVVTDHADTDAFQHGTVHPLDLLCDLQDFVLDLDPITHVRDTAAEWATRWLTEAPGRADRQVHATSHNTGLVRGFKEIRWTPSDVGTVNATGKHDYVSLVRFVHAVFPCSRLVFNQRAEGDFGGKWGDKIAGIEWQNFYRQDADWHSTWIQMDEFSTETFNGLLRWAGEPAGGCNYTDVLHANKVSLSPAADGSTVLDPSRCQLL